CARSRRPPRGGTSRRSPSRARWGPGSTSTPSAPAASSRIWRSRRPLQFRPSHTPVARDRWQSCGTEAHPRRPPGRATPPASPPECGLVSQGGEMQKEDKARVVADLTERLRSAETLIVADYRGLTMPQIDNLRGKLLEHGAKLTVVKNTLTRRA